MPVNLTEALAWKTAAGDASTMLDELQANILKGHVRDHLRVVFLNFASAEAGKAMLSWLAPRVKSARTHLMEADAHNAYGTGGTVYWGVGLSATGYKALGETLAAGAWDPSFMDGMSAQKDKLADPPKGDWEEPYRSQIHAVVLIGDQRAEPVADAATALAAALPPGVTVVAEETGQGMTNHHDAGIEHFGYVDGRSQPLFLEEDIAAELGATWDPRFPLTMVVTPDPLAANPAVQFGSYFVFRKLEQNVRAFKAAEQAVATKLNLQGADAKRAGAMLIGRFRDGTPLTSQATDGVQPVANDFDYDGDPDGAKCPFHAHIRKTNPRGTGGFEPEIEVQFDPNGKAAGGERSHLMARRGQTYGVRQDDPNDDATPLDSLPDHGVGLLFMAFNTILDQQFEFTQANWANFPQFPNSHGHPAPGIDPVIGQGPRQVDMNSHAVWGGAEESAVPPIDQTVTMLGGEYFFMPSRTYLASI